MIRVRRVDNSCVVLVNIIECPWSIEEGVAIDAKYVPMDFVRSGLELILGNPLGEAVLRGE